MAAAPGYVFVSYSSEDKNVVLRLVQALKDRHIPIRFDQDLGPGERWDETLGEWAKSAAAVLIVWSRNSAVSSSVIREASEAGDRLVPVTISGTSAIPEPFRHRQTIDLSRWGGDPYEKEIDQLDQALQSRLAGHPEPPGPPSPPGPLPGPASGRDTDVRKPDESRSGAATEGTEANEVTTSAEGTGPAQESAAPAQESAAPAQQSTGPAQETVFDFSTDTPGLAGDVLSSDDQLGIEDDVRILCQLALARSTKPPLAIGLFGDWGTGKSFFMRRMQTRVKEMQHEAMASLARGGTSLYCDNVVQVAFNAWHYADSNLWASVMTRIFESLKESTSDKARDYIFSQLESTQGRLNQARHDKRTASTQIEALKRKQKQLEEIRSAIGGHKDQPVGELIKTLTSLDLPGDEPKPPKGVETLADLHKVAQGTRSTALLIRQLLDWWPIRVLLVTALLVVLAGLAVIAAGGGHQVARVVSVAAVVIPTIVATAAATWRKFRNVVDVASQADDVEKWITTQLDKIEDQDRALASDRQQAQQQADQAARTIDMVRTGNLIRQYVEDRVLNEAYRDQLGVISLVRNDLQRLSDLCSPTDDGPNASSMAARFDIQRIVLYVDDLDRCPPSRVVEVLQAVHLLLAFPLFVVVAGVDSRWLITSLRIHYQHLLDGENNGRAELRADANEWDAFPADYLDKIFQIPFSLQPMSDPGYRALMKTLVPGQKEAAQPDRQPQPRPADPAGKGPDEPGQDEPGHEQPGQEQSASQPGTTSPPLAQEVRHFPVEGEPLAIRFVIGGRRLVVVTKAGIWVWNQGVPGCGREVSAQIQRVWFNADGGRLMYETEEDWVTLDLATGRGRTYQRPEKVVAVAVGDEADEIVYATEENWLHRLCGEGKGSFLLNELVMGMLVTGDRLLVGCESSLWTLALPELADATKIPSDLPETFVDMELDPGDRTLYALHPDQVVTWFWDGDAWTSPVSVSLPGYDPSGRLYAGPGGAFIRHASGLMYLTRQRYEVSRIQFAHEAGGGLTELLANPSIPQFALRSGTTLVVGRVDGSAPAEQARFEVPQADMAALSPNGLLVATAGDGSCRLWYIGAAFTNEDVGELELGPEEAEFIGSLRPVVPTARAAKRLVNVYRVLRASNVGREKLQDPATDDYKVAMLLLSLVTGWPYLALPVLRELDSSTSQTWTELLEKVCAELSARDRATLARGPGRDDENIEVLRALQKLSKAAPPELDRYQAWAPDIRRFSIPADEHVPDQGRQPTRRRRSSTTATAPATAGRAARTPRSSG